MRASRLSSVRTRGLETMRKRPLASAAERRIPTLKLLSIDPSENPIAPPRPVPTAAGKLTAKLGVAIVEVVGERPCVGVCPSYAPPAAVSKFGNATPVGLPVAEENVASPPH